MPNKLRMNSVKTDCNLGKSILSPFRKRDESRVIFLREGKTHRRDLFRSYNIIIKCGRQKCHKICQKLHQKHISVMNPKAFIVMKNHWNIIHNWKIPEKESDLYSSNYCQTHLLVNYTKSVFYNFSKIGQLTNLIQPCYKMNHLSLTNSWRQTKQPNNTPTK